MENLIKDLRYGVRMLMKNPGVTLVAVITLALGIGANTAIFSGVNAFLMRPLNVPDADELIRPMEISEDRGTSDEMSYPDYLDYRNQATSFKVAKRSRLSSLLLGINGYDVTTFVLALVASYLPARRETKVDPLVALRYE
jgi:putative ABC transport system permease protein